MASSIAPMSGVPAAMQTAATTGSGTIVSPPMSFRSHTITIQGSAGIGAGAVQVETSDDSTYAGTWVAQGSAISAVASAEVGTTLTGIFTAIRARISTTVTGGTVNVNYVGGKNF